MNGGINELTQNYYSMVFIRDRIVVNVIVFISIFRIIIRIEICLNVRIITCRISFAMVMIAVIVLWCLMGLESIMRPVTVRFNMWRMAVMIAGVVRVFVAKMRIAFLIQLKAQRKKLSTH